MVDQIIKSAQQNWALLLLMLLFGGGSTAGVNMLTGGELESRVAALEETVGGIDVKLNTIIFNQEVEGRIKAYTMRDLWNLPMQSDFQNEWYSFLQNKWPDLRHDDMPDLRKIQKDRMRDLIDGATP